MNYSITQMKNTAIMTIILSESHLSKDKLTFTHFFHFILCFVMFVIRRILKCQTLLDLCRKQLIV